MALVPKGHDPCWIMPSKHGPEKKMYTSDYSFSLPMYTSDRQPMESNESMAITTTASRINECGKNQQIKTNQNHRKNIRKNEPVIILLNRQSINT